MGWDYERTPDDFRDFSIRVADFECDQFTRAASQGASVFVDVPGSWTGQAFVVTITRYEHKAFVTLRPTGAPVPYAQVANHIMESLRARTHFTPHDTVEELKAKARVEVPAPGDTITYGEYIFAKEPPMTASLKTLPKFYVGSAKAITPNAITGKTWAKKTNAEAVAHAKQLLEETGEDQFIVKIIQVVRRKPQPIVVEKV